jgi:hypothetical protein
LRPAAFIAATLAETPEGEFMSTMDNMAQIVAATAVAGPDPDPEVKTVVVVAAPAWTRQ